MIAGGTALAVGKPGAPTPLGFEWTPLSAVARLETGHTPSRKHPEYWDGDIPWIGVRDATGNHGRTITSTNQTVTQAGIENSSARILPAGTVCLSRTASVGFVVTMGVPMATSQDFVNWVCGPGLDGRYLKFVFQLEHQTLQRFASGTTHQTIYFPEAKAFHVLLPQIEEQRAIADVLAALDEKIEANHRIGALLSETASTRFVGSADEVASLASVATVTMGSSPPGDTYNEIGDGLPFYQGVRDFGERSPGLRVWCSAPSREARPGDTLVAVRAPVGRLNRAVRHCAIGRGLASIAADTKSSVYYALATAHDAWRPFQGEGTVFAAITAKDLRAIAIKWPRSERLPGLERELSQIDDLLDATDRESETLAALRDTLLPELLSGRLRVPEAEDLVAGAV